MLLNLYKTNFIGTNKQRINKERKRDLDVSSLSGYSMVYISI